MKRIFDLVIFDLDGTLIDGRETIRKNVNHALGLHGHAPVSGHELYPLIGVPLLSIFERILPDKDKELAPQLVTDYRARYKLTSHEDVVIIEGVTETLDYLNKNGFNLAVATAKADSEAGPLLEKIGLKKYFDLVLGNKENMKHKPDPEMINYILGKLKTPAGKAVMVGDTVIDIEAGKNAKLFTVSVKTGVKLGIARLEDLERARPDAMIDNLVYLPPILQDKQV
ncbi:MAG: HAD family hydrolase [Candidatus Aenigmarchaeota archaeon]|nr:HAD family hydrolase [Candidatus Aenigmarchaeota archaeon]